MRNRANDRSIIARLVFIRNKILNAPRFPQRKVNAVTIAKEWECHCKTIHRDINFMRDQLGHEIEYDEDRYTLRYLKPPQPVL